MAAIVAATFVYVQTMTCMLAYARMRCDAGSSAKFETVPWCMPTRHHVHVACQPVLDI